MKSIQEHPVIQGHLGNVRREVIGSALAVGDREGAMGDREGVRLAAWQGGAADMVQWPGRSRRAIA
jgi:hypothetical protein